MQIETAAAIEVPKGKKQNESSFADQMRSYLRHPGSGVLALITLLASDQYLYTYSTFPGDRCTFGNLCSNLSGRICQKGKQTGEGDPYYSGNTFRNSLYCIWSVWYAVLCNCTSLGTVPFVRFSYTGNYDPSTDHAYSRGSFKISSGFLS